MISIFAIQLLGVHQLVQSLHHTLSCRDIQVRVESVQNPEAVETLDLRSPRPANGSTDESGALGGMA